MSAGSNDNMESSHKIIKSLIYELEFWLSRSTAKSQNFNFFKVNKFPIQNTLHFL